MNVKGQELIVLEDEEEKMNKKKDVRKKTHNETRNKGREDRKENEGTEDENTVMQRVSSGREGV